MGNIIFRFIILAGATITAAAFFSTLPNGKESIGADIIECPRENGKALFVFRPEVIANSSWGCKEIAAYEKEVLEQIRANDKLDIDGLIEKLPTTTVVITERTSDLLNSDAVLGMTVCKLGIMALRYRDSVTATSLAHEYIHLSQGCNAKSFVGLKKSWKSPFNDHENWCAVGAWRTVANAKGYDFDKDDCIPGLPTR